MTSLVRGDSLRSVPSVTIQLWKGVARGGGGERGKRYCTVPGYMHTGVVSIPAFVSCREVLRYNLYCVPFYTYVYVSYFNRTFVRHVLLTKPYVYYIPSHCLHTHSLYPPLPSLYSLDTKNNNGKRRERARGAEVEKRLEDEFASC